MRNEVFPETFEFTPDSEEEKQEFSFVVTDEDFCYAGLQE